MKKLLSVLLFVSAFYGYSQDSKIRFGIQGGLNCSGFWGYSVPATDDYSETPRIAYLGGLSVEFPIEKGWSLKIELNYERKSQKEEDAINGYSVDTNHTTIRKYDYLVLPVLFKYNFRDDISFYVNHDNSFYLNAGPFIGYLLKSKSSGDFKVADVSHPFDFDTTKDNFKTDFGLSLGFGKNFDLNEKSTLYLEFRVNLGLFNTSKVEEYEAVKTTSFNLLMGYSFN